MAVNSALTERQRRNLLRFLNRRGLKRYLVFDDFHKKHVRNFREGDGNRGIIRSPQSAIVLPDNFRGGNGNVGIIRSPVRAIALPDSRFSTGQSTHSRSLMLDLSLRSRLAGKKGLRARVTPDPSFVRVACIPTGTGRRALTRVVGLADRPDHIRIGSGGSPI
jgi:hypothetical protein